MSIFFAYIQSLSNNFRFLATFANSAVADEWWRAVATGGNKLLSENVQRISPQLYTCNLQQCQIIDFFHDSRYDDVASQFHGRIFFSELPGRRSTEPGIIPPQEVTETYNGDRFLVEDMNLRQTIISITEAQRTKVLVEVNAPSVRDEMVLIGTDTVRLRLVTATRDNFYVNIDECGDFGYGLQQEPHDFKLADLRKQGHFVRSGSRNLIDAGHGARQVKKVGLDTLGIMVTLQGPRLDWYGN